MVIEATALIFHPGSISLGENVYVGHLALLDGYHRGSLEVGDGTWIGPQCYLHAAGGITIGAAVGIGPGVRILTSSHELGDPEQPILHAPIAFAPVRIGEGCDLGAGAVILPGVTLGRGVQVGAGSVVTADQPDLAVAVGVPARVLRFR